jgi:hypothetical protein
MWEQTLELARRLFGLDAADIVERDVLLALESSLQVPVRLAMANEVDLGAGRGHGFKSDTLR